MTKNRKLKIKNEYLKLIIDLGYDYDGLEESKSLKTLIDDIVKLAKCGLHNDDKEIIYIGGANEEHKLNILLEEVKNKGGKHGK